MRSCGEVILTAFFLVSTFENHRSWGWQGSPSGSQPEKSSKRFLCIHFYSFNNLLLTGAKDIQKELHEAAERLQINTTENANHSKRFWLLAKENNRPRCILGQKAPWKQNIRRKRRNVSNTLMIEICWASSITKSVGYSSILRISKGKTKDDWIKLEHISIVI